VSNTTIPSWSATAIYTAGMEVMEDGAVYVANWWTSGNEPISNNGTIGTGEPWTIVSSTASKAAKPPAAPTALAATATTSSSTTLSWAAATISGGGTVTGYTIYENGTEVGSVSGTVTRYTATGLAASTAYSFTVTATDSAGTSAKSMPLAVSTPAGQVPPAPTGLTEQALTSSSVALAWTAPSPPAGATVSGYTILNNGKVVGTTTGTSFTVTGLTAATAYSLTVEATDQYGTSKPSAALAVKTPAASSGSSGDTEIPVWSAASIYVGGDQVQESGLIYQAGWWTQNNDPITNHGTAGSGEVWTVIGKVNTTPTAPDAPTGLTATPVSGSAVDLYWTAAAVEGSGTVSAYDIFANGKEIGTTTGTYYDATGLSASTAYKFTVAAVDATGTSPQSGAVSATTLAAGAKAATITFAPYVDMGEPSTPSLVALAEASGTKDFTLAFIQSSGTGTIGWSGTGTIADDTLNNGATIQAEVKALQAIGGNAIISFGGENGTDPAVAAAAGHESAAQLQAEYQSVITRYGVTALDFDIEGAPETNQASLTLRDAALKGLETANPGLQISYTLPVLPTGLDGNGVNIVDTAVKDGVDISVINIMAMDYGSSVDNGGAMGTDAIDAIQATEKQLATAGLHATIGVTPLIGVNDTPGEVFTLAAAQQLSNYVATDPDVTRVAMWSIGRDNGSDPGIGYDSPTASGLTQTNYEFSSIFTHA
jgi:chitodextrinase